MSISVGVGLAFVAMLCWGIGDFLIQRSTRKIGNIETLFIISSFGSIVLLPFVWRDLPVLLDLNNLIILLTCSSVLLVAALLDFEALRRGKLSIVEPIWSFEIPASGLLAFLILGEQITLLQILIIVFLILGLALVSFKEKTSVRRFFMERGVILALVAAVAMGAANFFLGWSSRLTDPLMANFFLNV